MAELLFIGAIILSHAIAALVANADEWLFTYKPFVFTERENE